MKKLSWKCLSNAQKSTLITLALVELMLLTTALIDISRRPSYEIKGRKLWWVMISFIEFFGPMAYFLFGRRNPEDRKDFI